MNTDIKVPKNFQEAYMYVNSRYIFNDIHYPALRSTTGELSLIFVLKHILLNIIKNVPFLESLNSDKDYIYGIPKNSFVKIWVNIFALMKYTLPYEGGVDKNLAIGQLYKDLKTTSVEGKNIFEETITFIRILTEILEKADHLGHFYEYDESDKDFSYVQDRVSLLASMYLHAGERYMPNIWQEIPNYMKSK